MPAKILVVDDDAPTVRLIEFLLGLDGYRIQSAPNGMTALDLCKQEFPDLIILNVLLPDSDGFYVCERLRHLGYSGPIIFTTARPDIPHMIRERKLDVAGCLLKPLMLDEIEALVHSLHPLPTSERSSK